MLDFLPDITVLFTARLNCYERVDYFRRTLLAIKKYLKYDGQIRYLLSVEYFPSQHDWFKEIVKLCSRYNVRMIMRPQGDLGLGAHMDFCIPCIGTELFFYVQDDWELLRPLDLTLAARRLLTDDKVGVIRYHLTSVRSNPLEDQWVTVSKSSKWCMTYNPALWPIRTYEILKPLHRSRYWRASEVCMSSRFRRTDLQSLGEVSAAKSRDYWFRHIGKQTAFRHTQIERPEPKPTSVPIPKSKPSVGRLHDRQGRARKRR